MRSFSINALITDRWKPKALALSSFSGSVRNKLIKPACFGAPWGVLGAKPEPRSVSLIPGLPRGRSE